jgi:hypothetical protein
MIAADHTDPETMWRLDLVCRSSLDVPKLKGPHKSLDEIITSLFVENAQFGKQRSMSAWCPAPF